MTGPELSRHLGSLDNFHVSATVHQDPSYPEDIQRNTEFYPEQQDLASETIPSQICEPHLDNSVVTLPRQQQPLSIACHLAHPPPSTTATSRLVHTTNYHLPTFDTVLTNSVHPSYQVVIPTFHYPICKAPIFNIFSLHQFRLQLKRYNSLIRRPITRLFRLYHNPLPLTLTFALPPITVGELVWVLRDFKPRGIWPFRRVEAVFPG